MTKISEFPEEISARPAPHAASGHGDLPGPEDSLASALATASESDPEQLAELARKRDTEQREKRNLKRNWLMGEPQGWVGRRVRSRRNNAVYTVSEVFRTGRVKLERNWMSYLTDVQTVRGEYETYC